MADVDIDLFGDHESRPDKPMDENIPLTPVGERSTWEPECEQEMTFGGGSQRTRLKKDYVEGLYRKLSESMDRTSEAFHFDYFDLRDGELYYRSKREPLMYGGGKLKTVKQIEKILGKNTLHNLGFDILTGKVTAQQAVFLNRVEEDMPSASDMAEADDIELQEIMENTKKSMEDLIAQFEGRGNDPCMSF